MEGQRDTESCYWQIITLFDTLYLRRKGGVGVGGGGGGRGGCNIDCTSLVRKRVKAWLCLEINIIC